MVPALVTILWISLLPPGDVNGDESADLICVQPDGGVAIYQTHTSDAGISFAAEPYKDDLFGFCPIYQDAEAKVTVA